MGDTSFLEVGNMLTQALGKLSTVTFKARLNVFLSPGHWQGKEVGRTSRGSNFDLRSKRCGQ